MQSRFKFEKKIAITSVSQKESDTALYYSWYLGDHPLKTSAKFHDFWPIPFSVGRFLLLSVGKFGQFLTTSPLRNADVLNGWSLAKVSWRGKKAEAVADVAVVIFRRYLSLLQCNNTTFWGWLHDTAAIFVSFLVDSDSGRELSLHDGIVFTFSCPK